MALSMMSGLFVAPMMNTFFLELIPSISVSSWLMTLSAAPPASPTLPPLAYKQPLQPSNHTTSEHGEGEKEREREGGKEGGREGRREGSYPRALLTLAMESSSSKNSTQGAACLALSNMSLTLASDSPNHIVSSSGPLIEMKFAWHSLAMALANRVLPHP